MKFIIVYDPTDKYGESYSIYYTRSYDYKELPEILTDDDLSNKFELLASFSCCPTTDYTDAYYEKTINGQYEREE